MDCDGVPGSESRRAKTKKPWEEEIARLSIKICPHQVSICEGASKGEGLAKAYVKGEETPESENKDCSSG